MGERGRRAGLLLASMCAAVLLSGCWDYREINQLAFVIGVGVDGKTGERELAAHHLVALPGQGGAQGGMSGGGGIAAPAMLQSATGQSVGDAFTELHSLTGRATSYSHVRVLVLGEKLAREGLLSTLDTFTRWYEFRRTMSVFIARPDAEAVLKVQSPLVTDPVEYLIGLSAIPALGMSNPVELDDLLIQIQSYRRQPVIPLIEPVTEPELEVDENGRGGDGKASGGGDGQGSQSGQGGQGEVPKPPKAVRVAGMAVFRGDRMVGSLDLAETVLWLILSGELRRTFITVHDPVNPVHHLSIQLSDLKRRVKPGPLNPPALHIEIELAGDIMEIESGVDYSEERQRRRLESALERQLTRRATQLIRRAQEEFRGDIFEFGAAYVTKFLTWDPWVRYDWLHKAFPRARVSVEVRVNMVRTGTTLAPIHPASGQAVPLTGEL